MFQLKSQGKTVYKQIDQDSYHFYFKEDSGLKKGNKATEKDMEKQKKSLPNKEEHKNE